MREKEYSEWMSKQGFDLLRHANCCKIAFNGGWESQQSKVDELQRRNQMLNDNIKEQGQKLVYQNEVIETQAEKLLGLRDEKAELQKRVDAVVIEIEKLHLSGVIGFGTVKKLEQALKGGGE